MPISWTCVVNCCAVLTCVLFILCLHTHSSEAGPMHVCSFDQRRPHPHGLCGRRIPLVLAGLCQRFTMLVRTSHGAKSFRKRSREDQVADEKHQPQWWKPALDRVAGGRAGEPLQSIFLEKASALSYLAKRAESGDIVCECCYHRCSVYELLQYCELPFAG